jgi:hypothetical protein
MEHSNKRHCRSRRRKTAQLLRDVAGDEASDEAIDEAGGCEASDESGGCEASGEAGVCEASDEAGGEAGVDEAGGGIAAKAPASLELTECWRALTGEYETTCDVFSTEDESIICAIMQEPTCSAKVDNLPCSWPLREDGVATANTVRLSCSHTFHAAALALHFLATDMRCPVCRKGSIDRMDIATVPLSVRHLYADKLRCLLAREVEAMDPVHIIEVLSNLELEMRMFSARDELGRPTSKKSTRFPWPSSQENGTLVFCFKIWFSKILIILKIP